MSLGGECSSQHWATSLANAGSLTCFAARLCAGDMKVRARLPFASLICACRSRAEVVLQVHMTTCQGRSSQPARTSPSACSCALGSVSRIVFARSCSVGAVAAMRWQHACTEQGHLTHAGRALRPARLAHCIQAAKRNLEP